MNEEELLKRLYTIRDMAYAAHDIGDIYDLRYEVDNLIRDYPEDIGRFFHS